MKKQLRSVLLGLMFGFLAASLTGCGKRNLTTENYNKIQEGMTLSEVEAILGFKGERSGTSITFPNGTELDARANWRCRLHMEGSGEEHFSAPLFSPYRRARAQGANGELHRILRISQTCRRIAEPTAAAGRLIAAAEPNRSAAEGGEEPLVRESEHATQMCGVGECCGSAQPECHR